jgi:hypothetical protein
MLQCSGFLENMDNGLGQFADRPSELWQSWAGRSSNPDDLRALRPLPEPEANIPIGHHLLLCRSPECPCLTADMRHMGRVLCVD